MTKPVRTEPEAVDELLEAARWYEKRRRGLGVEFLAAIGAAVGYDKTSQPWPPNIVMACWVARDASA